MNKELRELLAQISTLKTEARTLAVEDKLDEAEAKVTEIRALDRKVEVMRSTEENEQRDDHGRQVEDRDQETQETEYRSAYLKFLRNRTLSTEERDLLEKRAMSEGVPVDGGLIVPQDIQTRINVLQRDYTDLSQYVTVEPVTTLTGSRVVEIDAEYTPFTAMTELEDMDETDNPTFRTFQYAVVDRGGILPVSNSLVRDTDQNLMNYVSNWLAKKSVATKNSLILAILNSLTPHALADVKAIKKVLNVNLDPAISMRSIILTNQDGYNWLDEQEDDNKRPLLQPDPTRPTQMMLKGRVIVPVTNKILKSAAGKAPIFIGSLAQLIVLFSRQAMELRSTDVGGDAFKRNTTDVRAIQRDDAKTFDSEAVYYGQLTLS
jgi:HK97 family phage major capsid protein